MNITIRHAIPNDRLKIRPLQTEIADLHHAGRPDLFRTEARYYNESTFRQMLDDPNHFIFLAESDNGEPVGYAFAEIKHIRNHSTYIDFDQFYIDDICVAKKYRRQGVGTRLFERCLYEAENANCYTIDLGVYHFNKDAIKFYEKMGMRPRLYHMERILNKEVSHERP